MPRQVVLKNVLHRAKDNLTYSTVGWFHELAYKLMGVSEGASLPACARALLALEDSYCMAARALEPFATDTATHCQPATTLPTHGGMKLASVGAKCNFQVLQCRQSAEHSDSC